MVAVQRPIGVAGKQCQEIELGGRDFDFGTVFAQEFALIQIQRAVANNNVRVSGKQGANLTGEALLVTAIDERYDPMDVEFNAYVYVSR